MTEPEQEIEDEEPDFTEADKEWIDELRKKPMTWDDWDQLLKEIQ